MWGARAKLGRRKVAYKTADAQMYPEVNTSNSVHAVRLPWEGTALESEMWKRLASRDWSSFHDLANTSRSQRERSEVSYTLMAQACIVSNRTVSSSAIPILQEMERDTHSCSPTISKANRVLVESYYKLADLGIRPSSSAWIGMTNFLRCAAIRVKKNKQQTR